MKKLFLFGLFGLPAFVGFSQINKQGFRPAPAAEFTEKIPVNLNGPKTLLCNDTLRYPQVKEQILGTSNFYLFDVWEADDEAISQTFINSASHTISAVEFVGGNNTTDGTPSITVRAAIYNVDANNNPTTMLGSGTITFTSATNNVRRLVPLSAPVTVTGNYAVVLDVTSADGVLTFFVTDALPNQPYDEDLCRAKSSFYPSSAGNWVSIPTFTSVFTGGPFNLEPLVAPVVSYTINTDYTVSPSPACTGTQLTFTNTTTPMSVFSSRMYNFGEFRDHFNLANDDSTFVWDTDDSPALIWSQNATYTYNTAGTYDPTLITLGGFWNSCLDTKSTPIVVNQATDATFSFSGGNTFCSGTSNPIPTTVSPGTFSGSAGLVFVSTTTGEIDLATTPDGTYTVTYTTSGPCAVSSNQSITITSSPDAAFTYSAASFCKGGTNPLPVFGTGAGAGTFSAGAGLSITAGTGEINLATSTAGTYTVTNTIAASGSCPAASATFDVTINDQPTAVISGGGDLCAGSTATVPVTVTLTGTGPWTLTVSNGTTSQTVPAVSSPTTIPVGTIGAGTYTIVTVADQFCSNTGSGSATVTVNPLPTVTFNADTACTGTPLTLAATPAGGTFSGTGVTGNQFDPASGTQTITYTYTDANGCTNSDNAVITVNTTPTVTWTAPGTVCVYNAAFALQGGSPALGTYSGTGVTGQSFNPATAGLGTHTITYTVTQDGCTGTASDDIVVSECLSLEDIIANGGLAIYPNPATGNVTFSFSTGTVDNVNLAIISTDGKVVYENNFQTNQAIVDLSTLARATYFVRVKANGKTGTSKLILE